MSIALFAELDDVSGGDRHGSAADLLTPGAAMIAGIMTAVMALDVWRIPAHLAMLAIAG